MAHKYFLKCCMRYKLYFVAELILSYILATSIVKGNTIIGDAIDLMLAGEKVEFSSFIVTLLILALLGFVVAFINSAVASKFSIKVQTDYKRIVVEKLYRLQYRYFDQNSSASVINKVNADIAETNTLLSENLPSLCNNLVSVVTYAVFVGQINLKLLLLFAICYPVLLLFMNRVVKKIESVRTIMREESDVITGLSQDCVNGIMTLRAFGAEDFFQKKLNKATDAWVENGEIRTRISSNAMFARRILQWTPNIICAIYAYAITLNGSISLGNLVVFLMILQKFVNAFVGVPFDVMDIRENLVCVRRVEAILENPDEPTGDAKEGLETNVAIVFDHVNFSYTGETEVLSDMSFEIPKGKNVAFVGDSGGGKSTIFHLICGFYQTAASTYKLYGRAFEEWDISAAREQMALVSQNVFLFPTTIFENVRYGNLNATKEDIITACKSARIHDFIMGLPEGYESIVGERGILLSGGERQRISIARAFLKNAPILLLDEPTSAVDVETEYLIQEAISRLSENRTCITIAHRLSTIQKADEIMVLKDGRIAERGSHNELLKLNGAYAGMYGKELDTHCEMSTEEVALV